jgi:hypothetical protein
MQIGIMEYWNIGEMEFGEDSYLERTASYSTSIASGGKTR